MMQVSRPTEQRGVNGSCLLEKSVPGLVRNDVCNPGLSHQLPNTDMGEDIGEGSCTRIDPVGVEARL